MSPTRRQPQSGARLAVLRAVAEADGTITLYDLAEQLGISRTWARDSLIRPLRCGWVVCTAPPQREWGPMPRNEYTITDKGREHLASLADEEDAARAEG